MKTLLILSGIVGGYFLGLHLKKTCGRHFHISKHENILKVTLWNKGIKIENSIQVKLDKGRDACVEELFLPFQHPYVLNPTEVGIVLDSLYEILAKEYWSKK